MNVNYFSELARLWTNDEDEGRCLLLNGQHPPSPRRQPAALLAGRNLAPHIVRTRERGYFTVTVTVLPAPFVAITYILQVPFDLAFTLPDFVTVATLLSLE